MPHVWREKMQDSTVVFLLAGAARFPRAWHRLRSVEFRRVSIDASLDFNLYTMNANVVPRK